MTERHADQEYLAVLSVKLDAVLAAQKVQVDRAEHLDSRIDALERRFDALEGRLETLQKAPAFTITEKGADTLKGISQFQSYLQAIGLAVVLAALLALTTLGKDVPAALRAIYGAKP